MRPRWLKMLFFAPLAILAMALFVFIGGQVVMYLWNWLMPTLFGLRQLTFWQALGLLALCRILFGGLSTRGYGRSHMRRRMQERMEERCQNMTPEERERFRQRMRDRWGFGDPPPPSSPTA